MWRLSQALLSLRSTERCEACLATVVAAWEASTSKHTWRSPSAWDARVLGALVQWGYQPSEVERILLGEEPQASTDGDGADDAAEGNEASDEASDSAA